MISDAKSVFPVVVFDAADSWDSLVPLAARHLDSRGIERLRPVLDGKCQCVVIEREYIDRDYRDTFSHFHSKRFSTPDSRCVRLHFFSAPVTPDAISMGEQAAVESYLGYSVIRPTKPNCIGRTLLQHTLRLDASAHLNKCEENVHLFGTRLTVDGFPFISQDADATVCAQSALWMLMRYYSNRYPTYSEILPFQITNLAMRHEVGSRVYPSSGLYSWQLAEALRLQRFSPVVYSRKAFPKNFEHLLYTYIESGLPLLITLPRHAVVGFGHVSDYTVPVPVGPGGATIAAPAFCYSSRFNQGFVVNDDNKFPYQMLRRGGLVQPLDSAHSWANIQEFIVPLPEKVFLTAEGVQTAMERILRDPVLGIPSSPALAGKNLLLRLYLTSARSFKRSLRTRNMGNPVVEKIYRTLPIPHFIWICEIADYHEYVNDRKVLGEVIWDATRNAYEPDGWIARHFPESLAIDVGSALNGPQKFKTVSLAANNSYFLFNSNLHSL